MANVVLGWLAIAALAPSPTDREQMVIPWSQQAEEACKGGDFSGFFEAFARSPEVRRSHTAPMIDMGLMAQPARPGQRVVAKPDDFDITMVDYTYADRASVRRQEKDPGKDFIALDTSQIAMRGGGWRVEYQPAVLDYDGEGLGRLFGKRRAYIFAPYRGCWRLERNLR